MKNLAQLLGSLLAFFSKRSTAATQEVGKAVGEVSSAVTATNTAVTNLSNLQAEANKAILAGLVQPTKDEIVEAVIAGLGDDEEAVRFIKEIAEGLN